MKNKIKHFLKFVMLFAILTQIHFQYGFKLPLFVEIAQTLVSAVIQRSQMLPSLFIVPGIPEQILLPTTVFVIYMQQTSLSSLIVLHKSDRFCVHSFKQSSLLVISSEVAKTPSKVFEPELTQRFVPVYSCITPFGKSKG